MKFEELLEKIQLDPKFDILLSIVGTIGEVGEFANLVKKMYRDNDANLPKIRDEIADVMIYMILNAKFFNIDIVDAIETKLAKNETKRIFKKFEYTLEE